MESHADSVPKAAGPFALSLAVADGPALSLSIRNLASTPQAYLREPSLQPSLLVIRGEDGKPYEPRDDRKIKKQNNSPEPEDYATLAPGAADTLYEAEFKRDGKGYALKWGPFLYRGLGPGSYRVRAEWRSAQDGWKDSETGKRGKVEGIWKGKVESNEAAIALP